MGDAKSADALIEDLLATSGLQGIKDLIADSRPRLLAVHAVESAGMNAIPRVLAKRFSRELDLPLESGISQINRVTHTGASGYHRLAFPAVFEGRIRETD